MSDTLQQQVRDAMNGDHPESEAFLALLGEAVRQEIERLHKENLQLRAVVRCEQTPDGFAVEDDQTTQLAVELAYAKAENERLRAENERLQSGLRGIRREFGYQSINNGTATLSQFVDMLLRNDVAAARQLAKNTVAGGENG